MELEIGQRVHYIPFEGCDNSLKENGIVKSFGNSDTVFVVFKCNGHWEHYQDYTGQSVRVKDLKTGWI